MSYLKKAVKVIAGNGINQVFGFVLDINITYGDLHLAVGVFSDLSDSVVDSLNLELERPLLDNAIIHSVWSVGDWKNPSVNDLFDDFFEEKWRPWGDLISSISYDEICEKDDDFELEDLFKDAVLEKLAFWLHKFNSQGGFNSIDKFKSFEVMVIEHDESIEKGVRRMKSL